MHRSPCHYCQPSTDTPKKSFSCYKRRLQEWLGSFNEGARLEVTKQQKRFEDKFNSKLRQSRDTLKVCWRIFVRKEYYDTFKRRQKEVPVMHGPFELSEIKPSTAVSRICSNDEHILCNWNVEAPLTEFESGCTERNDKIYKHRKRSHEQNTSKTGVQQNANWRKLSRNPNTCESNHGY